MRAFAVIGPSQSGKTTLVEALAGLEGSRSQPFKLFGDALYTSFDYMGDPWSAIDVPGGHDNLSLVGPALAAADAAVHLERLALVEVNFPAFGDGRGYSSARVLREAGYEGELRAVGDVLVDYLAYMRRCGFDAFEPDQQFDMDDVEAALERWPEVYQAAADTRTPIWAKRHA